MPRASSACSVCRSRPWRGAAQHPRTPSSRRAVSASIPPVWHGRLAGGLDPRARALNDSLAVDQRLWPEELLLSRAYARSLAECGVLDGAGVAALLAAVDQLEVDLTFGRVRLEGEDVHAAIETELRR